jgi:hypothetical protein
MGALSFNKEVIDSIVPQPESLISSPISFFHLAVNQNFGIIVLKKATEKFGKNIYCGSTFSIPTVNGCLIIIK